MNENGCDDAELAKQIELVISDFQSRTLREMPGRFSRLIFLASLRDYNTGRYHHAGLETRHGSYPVDEALRQCHAQVFEELLALPLNAQTADLITFFKSLSEERARLVDAWKHLRSYRILPPANCRLLARDLFEKNIEIMLEVLRQTEFWELLHDPHGDADDLP